MDSPSSTKDSTPSPESSISLARSLALSIRWWIQDPTLWVQGSCQMDTRCFNAKPIFVLGSKALNVRVMGSSIVVHYKRDLVASIATCGATTSPCWHQWQFNQQSPHLSLMTTIHAPLLSSSLPLWNQWKRVSIYLHMKSLITDHCSPFQHAWS